MAGKRLRNDIYTMTTTISAYYVLGPKLGSGDTKMSQTWSLSPDISQPTGEQTRTLEQCEQFQTKMGTMTAQKTTCPIQRQPTGTHRDIKISGGTLVQILMTPNTYLLILLDYPGHENRNCKTQDKKHSNPQEYLQQSLDPGLRNEDLKVGGQEWKG